MTDAGGSMFAKDVADQVAPAWERYRDRLFENQRVLSEWMVDSVDPKPGQTILEIAAGPGDTGFLAAERLAPDGTLISTDLSDGMVDVARRGAATRGLTNIEFRQMDAQEIDLPDDSVDGALSRFGIMLLPEPPRAFSGLRRVLKPGGRLAYGVWGAPERNPWLTFIVIALIQHGHAPPGDPFGAGGPFSLAAPESNRELLSAAGFGDVETHEIEGTFHFHGLDDYWDMQTSVSGPVAALAAALSADERAAIKATLQPMVAPFEVDNGYDIPSLSMGISAQ